MKTIFFGSSDYCLPILKALKNDLVLVVTRPERPVGRKQVLTPSPVALWATKNNVPVITPAALKKDTEGRLMTEKTLRDLHPDLAVVADYGLIIPEAIFNLPKHGTFNIHFSRLPEFRGPSPVQFTLLRGDPIAWISIFKLENPPELEIKMDSGPILYQESFPVFPNDTTSSLYTRLFEEAGKIIPTLDFTKAPTPQDQSKATFTKMLTKEDGFVELSDLEKPESYNKFRAMTPWPGLWTIKDGKRMIIRKCHLEEKKLVLDEVQFEGKSPQQAP